MTQKQIPSEVDYQCNYDSFLKEFHSLWEQTPKDFEKFNELMEEAKNAPMSFRQTEGIIERCKNVINGTYGNTKKPEHYEQGKSSK